MTLIISSILVLNMGKMGLFRKQPKWLVPWFFHKVSGLAQTVLPTLQSSKYFSLLLPNDESISSLRVRHGIGGVGKR